MADAIERKPTERLAKLSNLLSKYQRSKPAVTETKRDSYVPSLCKKETPSLSVNQNNTVLQWKRYEEGVEYKDRLNVIPSRKRKLEGGEIEIDELSISAFGGVPIHYIAYPDPSYFDQDEGVVVNYCRYVGWSNYVAEEGTTSFLRMMPQKHWSSMYEYDNQNNCIDYNTPNDALPSEVYGERGQCRQCISSGNSTHTYESKKGTTVVGCGVKSTVIYWVTHVFVLTNKQKDERKIVTRNLREQPSQGGKFSGKVAKSFRQEIEMYRMEDLCDPDGEPLKPFMLAMTLPAGATRGKVKEGSVPIQNYAKVLARKELEPVGVFTICHLNIPETATVKAPVPDFQPFDAEGVSLYEDVKYNPFWVLPESIKEEIKRVMSDNITINTEDGGIAILPQFAIDALEAWEETKNDVEIKTFEPEKLGYKSEGEKEPEAIPVKATKAEPMKSAAPQDDSAWDISDMNIPGLDGDDGELS